MFKSKRLSSIPCCSLFSVELEILHVLLRHTPHVILFQPRGRASGLLTNRRIKDGEFEPRVIAPVIANAPGKKENG
jgi:hypothetical protein